MNCCFKWGAGSYDGKPEAAERFIEVFERHDDENSSHI